MRKLRGRNWLCRLILWWLDITEQDLDDLVAVGDNFALPPQHAAIVYRVWMNLGGLDTARQLTYRGEGQ
jgi:hypothetical protein